MAGVDDVLYEVSELNGVALAVGRIMRGAKGPYPFTLLGYLSTADGGYQPFQLDIPALTFTPNEKSKRVGRPKWSTDIRRAMAAQFARCFCQIDGHPITHMAHRVAGFSSYKKLHESSKKAPYQIAPGAVTFGRHVADLLEYPKGALGFIPPEFLDVQGHRATGDGFLWAPFSKRAEWRGIVIESDGDIPTARGLLIAFVPARIPK